MVRLRPRGSASICVAMRRRSFVFLLTSTAVLSAACFGDNSEGEGPANPDGPSILEISAPGEIDIGDGADVTVKVQGEADVQISVAISAALGTFEPRSAVVLTDAEGQAAFSTRYVNDTVAGAETITANASTLSGLGSSSSKQLTIYDVERLGNVAPLSSPFNQTSEVILAYPITLPTARVVRKLGITQPPQPVPTATVSSLVGLYSTVDANTIQVIAKTSAMLTTGQNEIAVPPASLPAGSYWMVVSFRGSATYYRSGMGTNNMAMRSKIQAFSLGLDDVITGISEMSGFFDRNFYLVLRK
jgi:hypothetical protein